MIAAFIKPSDPRWKEFLGTVEHDFYHLPEYVELAAAEENATPMAFYAEQGGEACLIPLLIRRLPDALHAPKDWLDCVSPYGYSGLLLSAPPERLKSFLEAFRHTCRLTGIVTAFLRMHPLFPIDQVTLEKFGALVHHGQTIYISLSESNEHIWRHMSTNHRRNIQRLVRSGFHVNLNDWDRFSEFITIYHSTMQRVGASKSYYFSMQYFQALRAGLDDRIHLVCVLSETNQLASAGLFVCTKGIVQYHLGGTAEEYLSVAPSKLMMDFAWRWAKTAGHTCLHLGGGLGGEADSLFRFKSGFSNTRANFYTCRIVLDERRKESLNHAADALRGTTLSANSDFFPRYRHL